MYKRQGVVVLADYLVRSFGYLIIDRHFRGSSSQKGEDLIIDKYFNHKRTGFYIDIGAYHPEINNNTNFFYKKGWSGINIEPNPARIRLFKKTRTKDININVGIGSLEKKAIFYEFEAAGLSTFSKQEADAMVAVGHRIKSKIKIQMYRLKDVIKKYAKKEIDFISIDTEGLDLEVLRSNNWKKYRPKLLCIETIDFADLLINTKITSNGKKSIDEYLSEKGYEEYASNGLNTIYIDSKQKAVPLSN